MFNIRAIAPIAGSVSRLTANRELMETFTQLQHVREWRQANRDQLVPGSAQAPANAAPPRILSHVAARAERARFTGRLGDSRKKINDDYIDVGFAGVEDPPATKVKVIPENRQDPDTMRSDKVLSPRFANIEPNGGQSNQTRGDIGVSPNGTDASVLAKLAQNQRAAFMMWHGI